MPDWDFDTDDESIEKQNVRVIVMIITIILILGVSIYYFAYANHSLSIIQRVIPLMGKGENSGFSVNIVSVQNIQFKNTSNKISVPLLNLNQPNMFSKFDMRINLIPSNPVPDKTVKFNISLLEDNNKILSMSKTVESGFPDYIEFKNLTVNSTKINEELKVYVTISSDSLYINDEYAGSIPFNKVGLGNKIVKNTGSIVNTVDNYYLDYSLKDKYVKKGANDVVTNTNTGKIILYYPLINQYAEGMPSFMTVQLKKIFSKWYFSTQTEYTIRSLISAEYSGEHTIYEIVNGNIKFDSVDYENSKKITVKFTPYYDYTLKVPYAETTLYYKIQKVTLGDSTINNYFTITGSGSQLKYRELHGFLSGDLKTLFKSIHLTVVVYTESGLERNIDFGDFDIVTGKTVLINDEGKAYLYPDENELTVEVTSPVVRRIDKIILTLNLNPIENPDKPLMTPKYFIYLGDILIKSDYLPQTRPTNQITVESNNKVKISRYLIIKSRETVQVNEFFIPYPSLEKNRDKVVNIITAELMKSKYIPDNAENIVKQRVSETLSNIKTDDSFKPTIIGADYVFKPLNNGFGFSVMLKVNVRAYGVALKPELDFTKVIDDTGKVFYYDIHGLNLNPTNRVSMVESVLVPLKFDDYKELKLRFTTTGNSTVLITKNSNRDEVKAYYKDMNHKFYFSIENGNTIMFKEPLPLSTLPRVDVDDSKLPESINMEIPIYSKTSGNIFIGVNTEVKNTVMYLYSKVVNLYGQNEYLASKNSIELVDNTNNYISVDGIVTSAGLYYLDKSNNFVKSTPLPFNNNYVKIPSTTVSAIKHMLSNNNSVIVYVFYTDKDDNVHYEEFTVKDVESHINKMMIALTNIQKNLKPGGLQFISDSNVRAISGYYTMSIYTGFFNSIKNTKLTITAVFNDNSKATVFSCTDSSCEFKLPKKDWVFDNDKYSVSDTVVKYSPSYGAFIVNILPIVSMVNDKQVSKYTVKLQFSGDGKDYTGEFTITPQPREYSVNINPVKTTYLTVSPVVISYSSPFDDLYYYEMNIHEPPVKTILNGVKVKVNKQYDSFGLGDGVVKFIGMSGKTLKELADSDLFKYEVTSNGIFIYPASIQYDSNTNPHNYKFDKNDIVVFLPMTADYDFTINSPLLNGIEVLVNVVKNYLNFHYYEFTPVNKNIHAGQTVKLTFTMGIPGLPDQYLDSFAKALSKVKKDEFKVYLVSPTNDYYECEVENITVSHKSGFDYVSVSVKVPSDIPQGTYAFALTQSGFSLLVSPVPNFDALYSDNPLNKFFVMKSLNYATDFIITTKTVTGAVLYGLNYGIMNYDNSVMVKYLPALLISGKQFKLFKLPVNSHYVFRVYSGENVIIHVPVLIHYPSNYQELFYYPQQVYLISVNNPSFKGYHPKNYVKSISVSFDNGLVHVELNYDVQHMYNKLPFDLFAVLQYKDKLLYYLPVSITPYYMIYLPQKSELKVDIELVNGAEVTRDITLIPTVVRVKYSGGKYLVDYASTVLYYKKSEGSYFGFSQMNLGDFDSPIVKTVHNYNAVNREYYNINVPLKLLSSNKIMFNEPEVSDYAKIILLLSKLSSNGNYVKKVDFPATYTPAGVFEVRYGNNYLYNSVFYVRFANDIDMSVVVSVHKPDINLIKNYVKSSGWVLKVNNVMFRVMAYTYNDNYYMIVYAKSKSSEAFFTINLLSIVNGNGAKIFFDGNVYYLIIGSVSYSTGIVNDVMIGVK